MTGLTILTSFKPFVGLDGVHQRNALASWRSLGVELEIVAFGPAPGFEPSARERDVRLVEEIEMPDGRLPRVDRVLAYGSTYGRHDTQVYVNGDILLFPDFVRALAAVGFSRFLMVGQRWDARIDEALAFASGESAALQATLLQRARLHDIGGMDYFAYRRGSVPALPPLYLGAAGWDNTVVFLARRAHVPVVDASADVRAIHQDHDYVRQPDGEPVAYAGAAAAANRATLRSAMESFNTTDASYCLTGGRLRPALASSRHAWRYVLTVPILRGWPAGVQRVFRLAAAALRRLAIGYNWLRPRPGPEQV